ncbi:MAG: hypothetical protein ACI837_002462 [Crocinitomicaceae bacterium]
MWLNSEEPHNMELPNAYHKNFKEASDYYYTHYSMHGENRNFLEKLIKSSVILSKIYINFKISTRSNKPKTIYSNSVSPPYTYNNLKPIESFCDSNSTSVLFVGIPAPMDAHDQISLRERYGHFFNEIPWETTNDFTLADYDGTSPSNHFNSNGHYKYAKFLGPLIEKALLEQN